MPHEVIRAAGHDRERSLGWLGAAWMEHFCVHGPGDIEGTPLMPGIEGSIPLSDDLTKLTVDCYALDGRGRRLYNSVFYSRPKGADKSGQCARFAMLEALGPCRFAGWAEGPVVRDWGTSKGERFEWMGFRYDYRAGEPMGRIVTYPFIRLMATEEGQTGNVYDAVYFNLKKGPLREAFDREDDIGLTRIFLPETGEIRPSTASSSAKDGGKESFAGFDETHLYFTPELRRMYDTVRRNLAKRKEAEPWSFEPSTMYRPGQGSVAEDSHNEAKLIREGKRKLPRSLFDHREGPADTDLTDEDALRTGLAEAYGDAAAYMDFERLVAEIWDSRNDVADSRRYFLNQVTAGSYSWVAPQEFDACAAPEKKLADGDMVTLGLDASKTKDHTVLAAMRVEDAHAERLAKWDPSDFETKENPPDVPLTEVDAAVRAAFVRFDVVGFYSDVREVESYIDNWEQDLGEGLCARAHDRHPIRWDMREPAKTTKMIEGLHAAIVERDMTHSGDKGDSQYFYNAKRWPNRFGVTMGKESPNSTAKVDYVASVALARQARQDYLALPENKKRQVAGPSVYEERGLRRL